MSQHSDRTRPCTAASENPAPSAAHRCNSSATPTTRPTTARNVRPEGEYSPTGPYRGYSRMIGREPLMSWAEGPGAYFEATSNLASAPRCEYSRADWLR